MTEPMSLNEFAATIENSDGIVNLLEAAIPLERIPEGPARELWRQLSNAYTDHLEPVLERLESYLDTFIPQPGDEGWNEYAALRDSLNPNMIRLASVVNLTPDRHGRRTVRRSHY